MLDHHGAEQHAAQKRLESGTCAVVWAVVSSPSRGPQAVARLLVEITACVRAGLHDGNAGLNSVDGCACVRAKAGGECLLTARRIRRSPQKCPGGAPARAAPSTAVRLGL